MPPSSLATVSTPPQKGKKITSVSGGGWLYKFEILRENSVVQLFSFNFFPDTPEIVEVEDVKRDEVAIVVGSRKNSMTKAVR